jgi:competence protein ComEA
MEQLLKTTALMLAMVVAAVGLEAHAGKAKTRTVMTGVLNLNSANAAQLDQLPGVGEKAVARIIEHRKKTPFTRPEELVKVKGFGKKKFEKLKPFLTLKGPTTLKAEKPSASKPSKKKKPKH